MRQTADAKGYPDLDKFHKALNRGSYVLFADKDGKFLHFNQEGLIDPEGKLAVGTLPVAKNRNGQWYASNETGYRLPEEARAAQQEKLRKLDKLRIYLESKETSLPLLFEGVHEGNITYGENISAISPDDKIVLTDNNDETRTFNKVEADGTLVPLKAPILSTKKDLLDSIFFALTHPEQLKGTTLKGGDIDTHGAFNALMYASQFLNLSHGIDLSENASQKDNPKANPGFKVLGVVLEKNKLKLRSYDDKGVRIQYNDLTNLSDSQKQEVKTLLSEQRITFSTPAFESGSVRIYSLDNNKLIGQDIPYTQFLSNIGVGQRTKSEDRFFNPSAVFDIDKVPEISQTSQSVPALETKKTSNIKSDEEVFEVQSGADVADFFPTEEVSTISSGVDVSDFFPQENTALKEDPTPVEVLSDNRYSNTREQKEVKGVISNTFDFSKDFDFNEFDLPSGNTDDTKFDPTCK